MNYNIIGKLLGKITVDEKYREKNKRRLPKGGRLFSLVITMLMRLCKCGRRLAQGQECTCRHKFYDKNNRDKSKKKFYGSMTWKKIVEAVRARANGLDEYQLVVNGVIVIGTTVHHIYTTEERPDLKTDLSNLIFVSAQTHNMIHAEYKRDGESKSAMQKILWKIHNPLGAA